MECNRGGALTHAWMDTWFMTKFAEQSRGKRMDFPLNGLDKLNIHMEENEAFKEVLRKQWKMMYKNQFINCTDCKSKWEK